MILETNGILIGEDESYAQELALYPFVHVRVSLKGCTEEEFARLTGADPKGFHLQLNALRYLKKAGVSTHPAVMVSFSEREATDHLYSAIWKIDPIMHSEIEKEEVILYPYVEEKLRRAGLTYYSAHLPERQEGKRRKGERVKEERPKIREANPPRREEAKFEEQVPRIRPKNARIIRIR
jgi:MoaA/NifB/PqqE/SkfB family radical SAM enzyme